MKPVDVVVPKALRESGHTAKVYREPYGVTLVIGPFNGPLTLLFDPAVQVIAAGNPCILKLSEGLPATCKVLLDLIPKYFDPRAVTAVTGSKDEVTELLKLPFDFIFFTGSVKVGKIVMEAAAKNLTPETASYLDAVCRSCSNLHIDNGLRMILLDSVQSRGKAVSAGTQA